AHPERLAIAGEPHASVEAPLEDGDLPAALTDEKELARLVGGHGERYARFDEPRREIARRGDRAPVFFGSACGLGRRGHAREATRECAPREEERAKRTFLRGREN